METAARRPSCSEASTSRRGRVAVLPPANTFGWLVAKVSGAISIRPSGREQAPDRPGARGTRPTPR